MYEGERQLDINTMASDYKFIYSMYTAEKKKKKGSKNIFQEGPKAYIYLYIMHISNR